MLKNKVVLASFVGFAMLAVAATTLVKQETYADERCGAGWHFTGEVVNGLPTCVPDKGTCPPDCPGLPKTEFPGCPGSAGC